jgi:hypothetical protein
MNERRSQTASIAPKADGEPHYLWSHPREAPRVCRPSDATFAAGNPDWVREYPVEVYGGAPPAKVDAQVAGGEATTFGLDYDGTITRDPDMWFAVMKMMQAHGHEVHIVTMRHGVESLMGGAPMEQRFLEGADGVHFTGNSTTGDRDAKRPHMEAKGIEVHVWIDDNPKAVHMSAKEIWGWCTQPGDPMIHSAPELAAAAPVAQAAVGADSDSACARAVWWNHKRATFTTTRQAAFAAWDAAIGWRAPRPEATAVAPVAGEVKP